MTFAEFAQTLYPYCGDGRRPCDFVVALIGSSIEDTDDQRCSLLDGTPDYLNRIYNGTKRFPQKDATFILGHLSKANFADYISDLSDDATEELSDALKYKGITVEIKYDVASKCADIFAEIMTNCANGAHQRPTNRGKVANPFEALKGAEALLATLPAPAQMTPPEKPLLEEQIYISELYAAYGDKEGIADFGEEHLSQYGEYNEDIKERRIDYFAAESIRRGVHDLYSGEYANQFDVLKDETLAGVRNTSQKAFPNGYERLLGVMEQAAAIQVHQYILSPSPNWIGNRIKMGVCHFLVNDKKLRWVKK